MLLHLQDQLDKKVHEEQIAKEQDELISDIEQKLAEIEHEFDLLADRYSSPQELTKAVEDLNQLQSLLDELPSSFIDRVADRQQQDQLSKQNDYLKSSIKVSI